MKSIKHWLIRLRRNNVIIVLLLPSFLSLGMVSCASTDSGESTQFQIVPVSSRDVAALSSDDIVRMMRRAGFSNEQILELGTQLRNALLVSGAVEIKRGKVVEAIFAVNDNYVYITARLRGNFIYNLEKGSWIGLETISSQSQPPKASSETVPSGYPQSNLPTFRNR